MGITFFGTLRPRVHRVGERGETKLVTLQDFVAVFHITWAQTLVVLGQTACGDCRCTYRGQLGTRHLGMKGVIDP